LTPLYHFQYSHGMGIVVDIEEGRHGRLSRTGDVDYRRLDREWDRVRADLRARVPADDAAVGLGARLVLWYLAGLTLIGLALAVVAWVEGR